jgi:DNA-binding winged helix-turn-helix (wHTH) protein
MALSFGHFSVDLAQRLLLGAGLEIRLGTKEFDLLQLLIEQRPRALSKHDIFTRLWPDTFVSEGNLATLVTGLRFALGDNPRAPKFIRTVYGFGYAFVGEVTESQAAEGDVRTRWTLVYQNRSIPLRDGVHVLGRFGSDVIVVPAPTVSRRHARLTVTANTLLIEDLGSKNGTWVGDVRVDAPTPVGSGVQVLLGSQPLLCFLSGGDESTLDLKRDGPPAAPNPGTASS